MVTCSIGDAPSLPGVKAFDIKIDPDKGLAPGDVDYVVGFPDPEAISSRVVQVNVYGPSTTDRNLLDKVVAGIGERLKGWGLKPMWNIQVPPRD